MNHFLFDFSFCIFDISFFFFYIAPFLSQFMCNTAVLWGCISVPFIFIWARSDVRIPLRRVSRFTEYITYFGIQMKRINYYHTSIRTNSNDSISLIFRAQKFEFFWCIILTVMTSFVYICIGIVIFSKLRNLSTFGLLSSVKWSHYLKLYIITVDELEYI